MRNLHASRSSKNWGLAALVLACGLANCNQADSDKQGEKPNLVQGFTPGGECPNPGSACWVPGYDADCFYEGDPYNCECVPTGLYNAHNWLCEFQGQGGSGGTAGAGGGPSGSGGGPGFGSCLGPDGTLFCGGQAPEGCFCDDVCEQAGDCCPDKFFFCGGGPAGSGGSGGGPGGSGGSGGGPGFGSCVGDFGELFCGGASDDGCFCDDVCEQFGDCCPDKPFVCGSGPGGSGGSGGGPGGSGGSGGSPGFGSCFAFNELWCGTISPDGCSCENGCEFFGDCCQDKFFVCDTDGGGGGSGGSGTSGSGTGGAGTGGTGQGGFAAPSTPQR